MKLCINMLTITSKISQNNLSTRTLILLTWVACASGCNPLACPRLPCNEPVKLRGQCCPYCPCEYDRVYYNVGELIYTDDPCVTCECSKYGIDCLPFPCPPVDCPNPVLQSGNCCPECGCIVDGILYDLGYQVYTRNPCEDCRCEFNGLVSCTKKVCPPLQCSNPVRVYGECCKVCACKGKRGAMYDFGPIEPVDECRPCHCNTDGTITCVEPICPEITCSKRNQYIPEGECCPKCKCNFKGELFYEGDEMESNDICALQCQCGPDGERVCEYIDCPVTDCENPVKIQGQCCTVCGCKDKGVVHSFGTVATSDICKTCTCNLNGTIICKDPECPEVTCDGKRKYTPLGECCPKCRCIFKSVMYSPGDDMPINVRDPCVEKCHCGEDGLEYCDFTECPRPDCDNPVTVPGQCCPQCGCLAKNKTLLPYGPITEDPCQACECQEDGNLQCGKKQFCPKVRCVSGVYVPEKGEPKQCCNQCRCKFGGEFYKPGEVFEGPRCQTCECRAFTGRVSCENANCSHVKLRCPNPTYKDGDCCPSCPEGPSCAYKKTIIPYGDYKTINKKQVCTCLGDPWFPNAFCAPAKVAKKLTKKYGNIWGEYGYPGMK